MTTPADPTPEVSPVVAAMASPGAAGQGRHSSRAALVARRVVAWILVVLVSILVPLSVVTVWSVRTVTNTDRYVETMAPLVREKVVTNYLAVAATDRIFESTDVQGRITNALPAKADFIAAPVTNQLKLFVVKQMQTVFNSDWFHTFWDKTNRRVHTSLVDFLTGNTPPTVAKAQTVAVTLTPAINRAIDQLDARGVTVFDPVKEQLATGKPFTFQIVNSPQAKQARTFFRWAKDIGWLLPLITLVLLGLALLAAVQRRKTLVRAAVGSAIAIAVFLALLALGRTYFLDHAGMVPDDVSGAVWDTVLRFLDDALRVAFWIAAVIAVVGWLCGPGRWAVTVRRSVWAALCWVGRQVSAAFGKGRQGWVSGGGLATARFIHRFESPLRIVGVAVVALIVLLAGSLSVATVLWLALALIIYLLVLQLVLFWARRAIAHAPPAGGPTDPEDPTTTPDGSAGPPSVSSVS